MAKDTKSGSHSDTGDGWRERRRSVRGFTMPPLDGIAETMEDAIKLVNRVIVNNVEELKVQYKDAVKKRDSRQAIRPSDVLHKFSRLTDTNRKLARDGVDIMWSGLDNSIALMKAVAVNLERNQGVDDTDAPGIEPLVGSAIPLEVRVGQKSGVMPHKLNYRGIGKFYLRPKVSKLVSKSDQSVEFNGPVTVEPVLIGGTELKDLDLGVVNLNFVVDATGHTQQGEYHGYVEDTDFGTRIVDVHLTVLASAVEETSES